ncbi:unnamed protein product [Mytilus edulis]|uniref:Myb-like domain-containing protein n=1 Tax=Mytilus edulis TaxID=6550 RepID=A0A8S3UAX1_MYTED|nr:unnamed protein product [Mytilus edulis]
MTSDSDICSVDRNNNYNKWTPEEKENLLATVTECTCNDSTEWKSVSESLNVMFGSNRTAKSCQNQYKRIMAFKDSENKVEMVNASCQTDISLNPNDNFVFMKMDEEILELRTNSSDLHDLSASECKQMGMPLISNNLQVPLVAELDITLMNKKLNAYIYDDIESTFSDGVLDIVHREEEKIQTSMLEDYSSKLTGTKEEYDKKDVEYIVQNLEDK